MSVTTWWSAYGDASNQKLSYRRVTAWAARPVSGNVVHCCKTTKNACEEACNRRITFRSFEVIGIGAIAVDRTRDLDCLSVFHWNCCAVSEILAVISPCVCLSLESRCSVETAERIELVWVLHPSTYPSPVLEENSGIHRNKGTSICYCAKLWISKISRSHIDRQTRNVFYRISSRKADAQRVIVSQLCWQYLRAPTLDRCSLSQ